MDKIRDHIPSGFSPQPSQNLLSAIEFVIQFNFATTKTGYAPEVRDLSDSLDCPAGEVEAALDQLQEYHGVVLHPNKPKIWAIHPFSLSPTNFIVKMKSGKNWWGCCAWCSLGVAAIVGDDVTITTSLGAEGERVDVSVAQGDVKDGELLVHFPVPMKQAWDNVTYTCSTMLIFKKEEDIDAWCTKHNVLKGDVQPLSKVWKFAQSWYGNHLNPDWVKWTLAEAKEMFIKHGLTHEIWKLDEGSSRF